MSNWYTRARCCCVAEGNVDGRHYSHYLRNPSVVSVFATRTARTSENSKNWHYRPVATFGSANRSSKISNDRFFGDTGSTKLPRSPIGIDVCVSDLASGCNDDTAQKVPERTTGTCRIRLLSPSPLSGRFVHGGASLPGFP